MESNQQALTTVLLAGGNSYMRVSRLRQLMAEKRVAGVLITSPENRRYLSGFTGSAGVLIITAHRQAIATDFRYYEQAGVECPDWELFEVSPDFDGKIPDVLRELELGGQPVGFEAAQVPVDQWRRWQSALDEHTPLVETTNLVETLRLSKNPSELRAIRQSVALADQALDHIYGWMRPGITERQVAWELESAMRSRGASAVAFEVIVASGPNGALPHARSGDRVIQAGEPVVLDLGCVVEGYCSDATRTVCLGRPSDDRYMELWNLVLKAQQAAESGIKAGITGMEGDRLAREVIAAAGYGEHFGHGLGHGVGLAIHEDPRLSITYSDPLPAGSVVTVEPGIYLAGWGGVRTEDMVVVREERVEVLTNAAKIPIL
jgi:Xaa-Pro aminopeptidase